MRYAIIKNGKVENVIEANADFAASIGAVAISDEFSIGDTRKGNGFEKAIEAPKPPVIPSTVSARQFKMQLEIQGITLAVETWVASQSKLVRIAYANSGRFDRNEPMLQAGFAALGFSQSQLDAFYTAAAAL